MDKIKEKQAILGFNFAQLTAQTFVTLAIIQVLSVFISIVTARSLGPSGKGVVAVLILYPTLLFTIGHFGLYRALTVQVNQHHYSLKTYCGSIAFFIITVSIIMICCFLLLFFMYNSFFIQNVELSLVLLSLGILPFLLAIQIYASILQTQEKIGQMNLLSFIQTLVVLFAVVVFVFFLKWNVKGAVLSYFLANSMAAGLTIYYVLKIAPWPWDINFGLLRLLLKDGLKLHIGVIAIFLFLKIDQLMLQHYKQATSVGFYSIAVSFTDLLLLIPLAIQNVFYAKISRLICEETDIRHKTMLVYKHNLFLLLFFSLFLIVIAKTAILVLYGQSFLPSLSPFFMLLPGAFFLYLNNILTNYLVGNKRFVIVSLIASFGALLNIVLNMVFIPRYDAWGAALASSITYFSVGILIMSSFLYFSRYSLVKFIREISFSSSDFIIYKTVFNSMRQFKSHKRS